MRSDPVLSVEGLGKRYRLGGPADPYGVLRESIVRAAASPLRAFRRMRGEGQSDAELFWALRDVSFNVSQGEVVGLIGRNGAGKSTLLKILSRITEPTTGTATMWGRIGSLLEVGTGFHPELTGRENIFLNGAILGMTKADITRRFDEIVAFAELSKFLDTPVKRYSSGMYVRLAFAVAAHLNPEILLIDEVLAVGDAAFQRKCLDHMTGLAQSGRTVLFVSHNLSSIANLCTRCLYLKDGQLAFDGPVHDAVHAYQADLKNAGGAAIQGSLRKRLSDDCSIQAVQLLSAGGQSSRRLDYREGCLIDIHVQLRDAHVDPSRVRAECWISPHGAVEKILGFTSGDLDPRQIAAPCSTLTFRFRVPDLRLRSGLYDLSVGCKIAGAWADVLYQVLTFQIGSELSDPSDGAVAAVVSDYDVTLEPEPVFPG
jgi:lipopolysaccharide transport system ATP-binding protein